MKFLPLVLILALMPLCGHAQQPAPAPVATATPQPEQVTVNVLGAVNRPLKYTMAKGSTVIDAIALAGDFTAYAASTKVKLIHKSTGPKPDVTVIDIKDMLNGNQKAVVLRDGDTLFVPQSVY